MGEYAQLAYNPAAVTVGPPLHDGVPPVVHVCEPRIWSSCACCGRRFEWCQASFRTVRAIVDERWVCSDCAEVVL